MSYTYTAPFNSPQSAVRNYRFPLRGERSSARLNLLLQAIEGDLKVINKLLEDTLDNELTSVGGVMLDELDADAFQS